MSNPTSAPAAPQAPANTSDAPAQQQQQVVENADGVGQGPSIPQDADTLDLICGPLINYKRMSEELSDTPFWHGSVLIVTKPSKIQPFLKLRCVGSPAQGADSASLVRDSKTADGEKLYEDLGKAFWRFRFRVPIQPLEANWEYVVSDGKTDLPGKIFTVPSKSQSMRILFHSCNGFSVGTDEDAWSGPALWNDVLRHHKKKPFHVMIGGGDQIYNDSVRVSGPLKPWTDEGNRHKRREFPFDHKMRADCDEFYYQNYVKWYGMEPFKSANCCIPQINIWDDHDIIDGFGSYTDHFMQCAVFRGIGGVACKYYLLFQQHIAPPKSTFTTDAAETIHANEKGTADADPVQLRNAFVMKEEAEEPCYMMGCKPGPYVEECSRNIYCQLGARIAFLGLDARMERTRHQVNFPETYQAVFDRLEKELSANKNIKHLILLLGVPIAYPRLQWLENIFQSPLIGIIRFLNRRFGLAGGMFNQFDGQVDLLDDLDDHYTARHHKRERREFIQKLQNISKRHSVRITILGGDVHLAAVGRFYSNPKQSIPPERDWRYMVNVISSAITNKPPPQAVANLLAKRNKIHHLDHDTDETLLEMFDHDPGLHPDKVEERKKTGLKAPDKKTMSSNHCTMPSRNFAIIDEATDHHPGANDASGPSTNGPAANPDAAPTDAITNATTGAAGPAATTTDAPATTSAPAGAPTAANSTTAASAAPKSKQNMRKPFTAGEANCGTTHPAASGHNKTGLCGPYGLDVSIRVEISNKDREGHTDGYGLTIPALEVGGYEGQGKTW